MSPYGGQPMGMYPGPGYYQKQGNGWALAALILGIIGVIVVPCTAPFAIWTGMVGMSRSRMIGGEGYGLAVAGLVLGIIGLLIMLAIVALYIFIFAMFGLG